MRKLQGVNIFNGESDIKSSVVSVKGSVRRVGYISIFLRLKCAFLVAVGKADIVVWYHNS